MKIQLPWEKSLHRTNAFLMSSNKKRFSTVLSKKIAIIKMDSIKIISDEFNGDLVLFEPLAWVLLESDGKLDFWGAYRSEDSDEADTEHLPKICIRKANWSKAREREALKLLEKNAVFDEYFLGEEHVKSEMFFLKNDEKITQFANKAFNEFMNKLHFNEIEKKSKFSYLKFYVYSQSVECNISYSPCIQTEKKIENLANDWIDLLSSFDKSDIILSDNKLRISYQDSLLSYIKE